MEPAKEQEHAMKGLVLLVGADADRRDYLSHILNFLDYSVSPVPDGNALAEHLKHPTDANTLVFVDQGLPDELRPPLWSQLAAAVPNLPIFLLGAGRGEPTPEDVPSPVNLLGSMRIPTHYDVLINLLHKAQVFNEAQSTSEQRRRPVELFRSLSGNSRAIRQIGKMIMQVADSEATVLILGESGTGKEVVARKLHYHSSRRGKPFVPVNCGAIPADLLESELFGHEKGAFTGAISARQGRFEMAEGGTLFLDEIGDMSMPMQVKILRVLQERTFERVGSNKTLSANVRIIAATHRNLEKSIRDGSFREDLYYRVNVFPIEMPPLRERREDIPVLISDLITRIEKEKRGSVRLTPTAVTALAGYSWPGNVRELANLVERLAILFPYGVVDVGDLPEKFRPEGDALVLQSLALPSQALPEVTVSGSEPGTVVSVPRLPTDGLDLKAHLSSLEQSLIQQALDDADGVVAHAAKRLNMRRTTLVEKLRKYGLHRGQEQQF